MSKSGGESEITEAIQGLRFLANTLEEKHPGFKHDAHRVAEEIARLTAQKRKDDLAYKELEARIHCPVATGTCAGCPYAEKKDKEGDDNG